ncbi:MAG: ATPase, T2SS/T4P/T4SS family [Desulfobacterales bacterium]|jgi:type II secretory ATPase GspE/PulE/Tfp pilus assembly ATPase PilB-like protein|nr:ATPase, T2SS/T4P/T4SS family [Desulfobacterales bacterium]
MTAHDAPAAAACNPADVQHLQSEVAYRTRLQEICNKIYAAKNLDGILIDLREEITTLFEAERITLYVVDGKRRELVSRFKSGSEVAEIRVPIAPHSLAGFSAMKQQVINVVDAYDEKALSRIDPALRFDKSWDRKTGFRTRAVLVCPVVYRQYLLGVIQLINRTDSDRFVRLDEWAVQEMAKILAIALYNQKRLARGRPSKFDYILENHILTQKELERAIGDARKRREPIETVLMTDFKVPKEEIGKALSKFYQTAFVPYNKNAPIPGELLARVKVPFMKSNCFVPLRVEDGRVLVAIDNPQDLQRVDNIRMLFNGQPVTFVVALKEDIQAYISLFTQDEKEMASMDEILRQLAVEESETEEADAGVGEEDSAVVQLVNKMIIDAYNRGASDIHIEPYPGRQNTQVRFRIDGLCQVYQTIPFAYRKAIVSRIKIMSDLDIAERRKPQDGKIRFKRFGGLDLELRVVTVPTQGGLEDVVLRLLSSGEPIALDKLGLAPRNYENFLKIITRPYGLIFVCGPTGSGKTTTLHSALGYINKTETKIWTAEDPVEITQRGLRQVQVQPKIGLDFPALMRSFLRADPDVIMVGEMRDRETTAIGIEASLTGHLVLSTLHTNSAPESITRLLDMGMDPFNFADAILGILAQRLARTLCPHCKQPYTPSRQEYDELVREYGGADLFTADQKMPYTPDLTLKRPVGCELCGSHGYLGRCGIHELLMGTAEMKKLIQQASPMEEIRAQAVKDGMTTLRQDGVLKIFDGLLDIVHVRKVTI